MRAGSMGKNYSLDTRGKFGKGGGFGRVALGYNHFGFYSWYSGIYQKLYYFGKPHISRKKFNWGSNPQTELQQAWRAVLASGWVEWATYTDEQKNEFKIRAVSLHMSGANLFMREWLISHRF